jgi:hypothetical protein
MTQKLMLKFLKPDPAGPTDQLGIGTRARSKKNKRSQKKLGLTHDLFKNSG